MAINAFGHGDLSLPYPEEDFSHGPDHCHKPSCCSGTAVPCDDYYDVYDRYDPRTCHDNCCCCDPCRHLTTEICQGGCCKCVPRWICMTFTPDTVTDDCQPKTYFIEVEAGEGDLRMYWTRSFPILGALNLSVGEVQFGSALDGYEACSWKLETDNDGTLEEVASDHSGDINCLVAPPFTIENMNLPSTDCYGATTDCFGTLSFSSFLMEKVPFVRRFTDSFEPEVNANCGYCTEACSVLAVNRGNTYDDTVEECVEFSNVTDESGYVSYWLSPDGYERIDIVEQYGECYLQLTSTTPATLIGDLIQIDPDECSIGMNLTAEDYLGNYIQISCNPCHCWSNVCGDCRCACPSLCVVGVEAGYLIDPMSLSWDVDNSRWGDDAFSVQLSSDDNGDCQVTVTGFEDPVPLPDACSPDIAFVIASTIEQAIYDGGSTLYSIFCAQCPNSCQASGACIDICDTVPQVLFATISPQNWIEMLGCDYQDLCFEPFTMPLVQVYSPDAAGEFRWIGQQVFSCRGDCFDEDADEQDFIVQLDIGCDGIASFSVTDPNSEAIACTAEFSFELPCGTCNTEVWDFEWSTETGCGSIDCCAEAGFDIAVSE